MDEQEIRTAVEKLIADNSLDASIFEIESEDGYDGDFYRVTVEVARKDYNRVYLIDSYTDNFSVHWHQRTPELIGAKVGDFVLIYNDHVADDDESDVGLVTSKFVEPDGTTYYGCRYLQISLNNRWVDDMYDFQLTEENYGGYPTGFLKVLTKEEITEFLSKRIEHEAIQAIEAVNSKRENSTKRLPALIEHLGNFEVVQCEKLDLSEDYFGSLKVGH